METFWLLGRAGDALVEPQQVENTQGEEFYTRTTASVTEGGGPLYVEYKHNLSQR